MNTLFESLTNTLQKVDPINLNATLSALGEGLRGNGDDLGATLSGLNYYLQQFNPKLPSPAAGLPEDRRGRQRLR